MSDTYYASSASVEWYTPGWIVEAVQRVLGAIDCDPCSNPPPYNVPAAVHWTQADDGLIRPWAGRCYVNPPYGDSLPLFVNKLLVERALGRCTEAITLTPARTDTRWWQPMWGADAICFLRGRVAFIGMKEGTVSTFPSVITYWGPQAARFAEVFRPFGQIIYPDAPPRAVYQLPLLDVA